MKVIIEIKDSKAEFMLNAKLFMICKSKTDYR